jgi:hypothetical protein
MQSATDLRTLRTLLGALEANLKENWLSSGFEREPILVKNAFNPVGKEVAANPPEGMHVEHMRLRPADVHHGAFPDSIEFALAVYNFCYVFHVEF